MPVSSTASSGGPRVEVRRSTRRRRTATAYRNQDTIVVLIPARVSQTEERTLVADLVSRVLAREQRAGAPATDADLQRRAERLAGRFLAGPDGPPRPNAVRWVTNQQHRWGSCTPGTAVIRLSSRLQTMPDWVVDYVLVHELAHLVESGHTPTFRRLVARYPQAERAEGYLDGYSAASRTSPEPVEGPAPAEID